jgi:transcriptional regulator with XRE-family HTH domain
MASATAKKMAKRIRELRLERGWTQEEAAKRCNIKYKYYQEYEGGKPRDMRLSTMERFVRGFEIEFCTLFK